MKRFAIVLALTAFGMVQPQARAGYGNNDPRLTKLYGEFIAPCCWREALTAHDSPAADELRASIAAMVREGKTDEQIREAVVAEHSRRVLIVPDGPEANLLFLLPWAAALAGLALLAWVVKRLRQPAVAMSTAGVAPLPEDWDLEP